MTAQPPHARVFTAVLALTAVVLLIGCSAETATLPDGAPTVRVTVTGAAATCSPPDGSTEIVLDAQPVRLVENAGNSQPTDRIELSGTVTNYGGRPLYVVAGGADALCPLLDVTRVDLLNDGPFRAGVEVSDGARVFAIVTDAPQAELTCDSGCLDAGTGTIFGISDSVIVTLE